jgi:type I restriction enzyme, R subunit
MAICEEAFHVMYWLYSTYTTDEGPVEDVTFDANAVPKIDDQPEVDLSEFERLQKEAEERAERLRELERSLDQKDEALAQRNREIKQMRLQSASLPIITTTTKPRPANC